MSICVEIDNTFDRFIKIHAIQIDSPVGGSRRFDLSVRAPVRVLV